MTLKQWKRWEKLRKNGKIRFILFNGALLTGSLSALAVTLFHQLIDPIDFWVARFIVYVLTFSFVSMLGAVFIWNRSETKFMSENPPLPKRIK
jgi:hypothetical protein